jgi:hypothetical protein
MNAPFTRRQQSAETALSHAFLKALVKWAERHTDNDRIAIPTGAVTAAELVPVLRALRLARKSESAP